MAFKRSEALVALINRYGIKTKHVSILARSHSDVVNAEAAVERWTRRLKRARVGLEEDLAEYGTIEPSTSSVYTQQEDPIDGYNPLEFLESMEVPVTPNH